ncbi:hypothetical protein ACFLQO_01620 [Candidatus Aenigmatarchaeota archaeon]
MKIEIKGERKNPLMKREEVTIRAEHSGKATPSRKDLLKEVATRLKSNEDLIIIDKIFSAKGRCQSDITVLVYKKKDDIPKDKLEKMKRRLEKKKKPGEEEPAPTEAKPAESAEKPVEGEEKPAETKEEKPAEPETKPDEKEEKKEEKTEEKAE